MDAAEASFSISIEAISCGAMAFTADPSNGNPSTMYKTGEPYGLAEGLTMDQDSIYIGIDNNKNKLSKKAKKSFGLKGNFSSIIIYRRPKGF